MYPSDKSVGYLVAAVLCIYALVYKIPLPCFGCQKEGFWYRCVMGTGEGTESCYAHEAARKRVETAGNIVSEAAVYMDNLWDFTKKELPEVIKDFIASLKTRILDLRDNVAKRIDGVISFLREKILLFVNKVKDGINTVKDFIMGVVQPILGFFTENILKPASELLTMLIEFYNMVRKIVWDSVHAFANLPFVSYGAEVVDIFKSIPNAINSVKTFVVDMINSLKNNLIGVVNAGIRQSIEGIEHSINTLGGGVEDGANLAVEGLNYVKQSLIQNLNSSINGLAGGIETAVNASSLGIETAVNTSVNGVTGAINMSMNGIETSINGVIGATNDVIGHSEDSVNFLGGAVNSIMGEVESKFNKIGTTIATNINTLVNPINKVIIATQTLRNVDFWNMSPFTFIPSISSRAATFVAPTINLPEIPDARFGEVKFELDIPDIKFDGIDIPELDIPEVDITEPDDIADLVIPDVSIPVVEIPIPDDLDEDALDFPSIPGLGFVSDRISELRESIQNIFLNAMQPVLDAIATTIAFVSYIISSTKQFWEEYMTLTKLKERAKSLMHLVGDRVEALKALVRDEVIPGIINLILGMKEPILDFAQNIATHTWSFLKTIGTNVAGIFNEAFKVVVKVTGVIAKGTFHTGLYIVGTTVEKYTAIIPIPISVKMLLLFTTIIWMFFGGFVRNAKSIVNLGVGSVKGAAMAISDLDKVVDSFFGVSKRGASSFLSNLI